MFYDDSPTDAMLMDVMDQLAPMDVIGPNHNIGSMGPLCISASARVTSMTLVPLANPRECSISHMVATT